MIQIFRNREETLITPALEADSLPSEPPGSPHSDHYFPSNCMKKHFLLREHGTICG